MSTFRHSTKADAAKESRSHRDQEVLGQEVVLIAAHIYIICVCVFVEPIVATRYGVQRGGQQMAAQAKSTRERQSMM